MTKHDILGELTTYGLKISASTSDKQIREKLEELRKEIPKWKKELNKEE